jgi:hypothetical protein
MLQARLDHTATLLSDGTVLVTGGQNLYSDDAFRSAELWNPLTGGWAPTASMTHPRFGHTATLLPDGRVLVAGGRNWVPVGDDGARSVDLSSAEVFDPATATWTAVTDVPDSADVSSATPLLDGRVLFLGTASDVGYAAQIYDPASETWMAAGTMSVDHGLLNGHEAILLSDGRVLVVGGWGGSENPGRPNKGAELYDPETNTWTPASRTRDGHAWFAAGLLPDGRVIVAGSGDGGYGGSRSVEVYDPATDTWMLAPDMLAEHGYHRGVVLGDGRFLVVGGYPAGQPPSAEIFTAR